MEQKEVYTITILRNYGEPISLTLRRKSLILAILVVALVFGLLMVASIDYLLLGKQAKELSRNLESAQKKLVFLTKEIRQMDSERFKEGVDIEKSMLQAKLINQKKVDTAGLAQGRFQATEEETFEEGTQILVDQLNVRLRGDQLRFQVTLNNKSNPPKDQGGYLCLTLINEEEVPTAYKAATGGALGQEGFPLTYKSGRQYVVGTRRAKTVKVDYKLESADEYYTHVMILIYSYQGSLLTRTTEPLDRNIFFE